MESRVVLFAAHAYVGESIEDPAKYYRNNICASIECLDSLLEAGVRRLVVSSSCTIYGIPPAIPITEDARMSPLSPYAESKAVLENVLRRYDRMFGLRYVSLRYFNAADACPSGELGEDHNPETHLIPRAIAAALGKSKLEIYGCDYATPDGTAVRDYIHVTDLADAHVRALEHLLHDRGSARFNCGGGRGSSVQEIIQMVERVSGRTVPFEFRPRREGDAPVWVADSPHPGGARLATSVFVAGDDREDRLALAFAGCRAMGRPSVRGSPSKPPATGWQISPRRCHKRHLPGFSAICSIRSRKHQRGTMST